MAIKHLQKQGATSKKQQEGQQNHSVTLEIRILTLNYFLMFILLKKFLKLENIRKAQSIKIVNAVFLKESNTISRI